jgi:ABC-type sugar transport system ATPase subunit
MRIELARLHADLGTTMIYVTHDQTEAMTLGDRIAVFNQGRIEQLGQPLDLYQQPRNRFVAEFLGSPKINLLTIESTDADGVVLNGGYRLGAAHLGLPREKISQACVLGIRPEAWQVVQAQTAALKGTVEFVEHLGDAIIAYVRLPGQSTLLTVKTHAQVVSLALSQDVYLMPQAQEVLVFDKVGHRI